MKSASKDETNLPVVGRSIGRKEVKLDFGKYPISGKMGPRYLTACQAVVRIIDGGEAEEVDLSAISEVKGMYNRVLRQDRPDWEAVRHLLGEPDRAVCNLAAVWLADLRLLLKDKKPTQEHLARPVARGIRGALARAYTALNKAGFY